MSAVEVYEHAHFAGWMLAKDEDVPWIGEARNDRISSIVVHEGQWEFFEHIHYGGRRWVLEPGRYPWIEEQGIRNDIISSFRRNWFWVDPALANAWDDLDRARGEALEGRAAAEEALRAASEPLGGRDPEGILSEARGLAQALADRRAQPAALKARLLAARERKERALAKLEEATRLLADETRALDAAETLKGQALTGIESAKLVANAEQASRMVAESLLTEQARARAAANERLGAAQRAVEDRTREAAELADRTARETAAAVAAARREAAAALQARVEALERTRAEDVAARVARARELSAMEIESELAQQRHKNEAETREAVAKARAEALAAAEARLLQIEQDLRAPAAADLFDRRLGDGSSPLAALVNANPSVSGAATREADSRDARVVLATVRDREGLPATAARVQLLDEHGRHLDETFTDANGAALLRFPESARGRGAVLGVVAVPHPGREPTRAAFKVPPGAQHAVVDVPVERAPPAAPRAGDPFERLPSYVTPTLFDDLLRVAASRKDPIVPSEGNGFSSRRAPIVRRMVIPRVGPPPKEGGLRGAPARRYQVSLRQEWVFVGYTLGEMAGVEGLRPGETLHESTTSVARSVEEATSEVSSRARRALAELEQASQQVSKVSSLVRQASRSQSDTNSTTTTDSDVSNVSGGVSIPFLGGVAGSKTEAYTRVDANLRQTLTSNADAFSNTDASHQASSMMRAAQSEVNEAVRRAVATASSLQTTAQRALGRVSPLLARATNVMEWTLYENYLVCTRVEDVKEVVCERVVGLPQDGGLLFSGEDVVEYMRFFAIGFLDWPLLERFAELRGLVEGGKDTRQHPLVKHVNRNRRYYMGRLLNAALVEPSLRDDAPQLRGFGSGHLLWRLPILGFEGDTAVFTRDVTDRDEFAKRLLSDAGTATLVQIAAPGGYTEVVQGLCELADLKGKIPPALQQPIHVVPGDFKVLDLAPREAPAQNGSSHAPTLPAAPQATNGSAPPVTAVPP